MKDKFKLLKPFGKYKAGEVFDCHGGLFAGITNEEGRIDFANKEWFELYEELPGCFNKSADSVKREDKTWSDCNLDRKYRHTKLGTFKRLKCRNCGGLSFEVLITGDYETSAKCTSCNMYYIAHSG